MFRLERRLQKLEAVLIDRTGLRLHSREWRAHWETELSRIVSGEASGRPSSIPLEVWDDIED